MSVTYLLSSLPALELGAGAPFSVEECRRRYAGISGVSLSDFDAVASGTPGSHPFTVAYANVSTEIKNATAALRASKWEGGVRASEHSYLGYHAELHQKISEAMSLPNPLDREIALEKAHWQIIEELAGIAYFSEAKAYAYIAKLQINNRIACFNEERGKEVVEDFIKANDHEVAK
jgi:hypothetical protein